MKTLKLCKHEMGQGYCGLNKEYCVEGPCPHEEIIEYVQVVRCKDCRRYNEQYHYVGEETGRIYSDGYCRNWDHEVYGDDFCSYGERKENG